MTSPPLPDSREWTGLCGDPAGSKGAIGDGALHAVPDDAALVERLADSEFTGPEYAAVEDRLTDYAYGVISAWVRSGEIYRQCALKKIRGVIPLAAGDVWSEHDLQDLVQDTIGVALVSFHRNAMVGGKWRPDGGASLATYFIGTCCAAFADCLRRHRRTRSGTPQPQAVLDDPLVSLPTMSIEWKLEELWVEEYLASISDTRIRLVLTLKMQRYNHAEIAELLADGSTAKAVEAMLYRFRKTKEGLRVRADD